MMDLALQLASNILIPGAIFALVATGFSLIYSVTRMLHIAHGATVITSGYLFYAGVALLRWPVWASVLLALAASVLLGMLENQLIYERLRTRTAVAVAGSLIATFSLLLILQNVILAAFGSATKSFPRFTGALHEFGPVTLSDHEIRILLLTPILLIALGTTLAKTKLGKALRAVADQETVAEVVGIPAKKMRMLAFAVGSFLAGVAGILFAIEYNLEPSMSTMVAVRMFFRAIIGGVGSMGGAVLGSLLTETVSTGTSWYVSVAWFDLSSFVATFVVLLIRPQGLFGKKKRNI